MILNNEKKVNSTSKSAEGRLSVSNYEQNGEKRKSTKVVVNSFEFVESSGTSGNNGGYQQQQSFSNNTKKPVSVQNDTYELRDRKSVV